MTYLTYSDFEMFWFLLLFCLSVACDGISLGGLNKATHALSRGVAFSVRGFGRFGKTRGSRNDFYCDAEVGQFKAYDPCSFDILKLYCGVLDDDLQKALEVASLQCFSGDSKSNQGFWISKDNTIVLKTITRTECITLRNMLKSFVQYVKAGQLSCITAVLGLYRVKLKNGQKIYFLCTKNVFQRKYGQSSFQIYDLKGSVVGRLKAPSSLVLKDLDLVRNNTTFMMGRGKQLLLEALKRDTAFLSSHNLMDYSLLTEVESTSISYLRKYYNRLLTFPVSTAIQDRGKFVLLGDDGRVYHFGIIDFLQRYTLRKWLETWLKRLFYGWRAEISCIPPQQYGRRLVHFINCCTC